MKKCCSKKGLTLIELIVAMAILSIITVSLLGVFTSGFSTIYSMGYKNKAMADAQKVMDMVYKSGSISTTSIQGIIESTGNSGRMTFSFDENFQVATGLYMHKVTIKVSYYNGTRSVSLTSLIP